MPKNIKTKKMTAAAAKRAKRDAEPFLLTESDPANFWGNDKPKVKRRGRPRKVRRIKLPRAIMLSQLPKDFSRGNTRKYLTKSKKRSILRPVNKLKRKDDKKMAHDKTKKSKGKKLNMLKSIVWLAFAVQQAFIGYLVLSNFDNYFAIVTALISLGIAGAIVLAHFVRAYK